MKDNRGQRQDKLPLVWSWNWITPISYTFQRSEAENLRLCTFHIRLVEGGINSAYQFQHPPKHQKKKKNNKTNHSSKCFHCISHGQKWRKNNEEHFSCFYRKWAQTIGTQSHFLNCQLLMLLLPYIMMRSIARPTAETETRVPMQYLIISYFAPSNWALIPWISCCQRNISESDSSKAAWNVKQETHSVNLIVQVGGFCTLICKLITCAPTLQSN